MYTVSPILPYVVTCRWMIGYELIAVMPLRCSWRSCERGVKRSEKCAIDDAKEESLVSYAGRLARAKANRIVTQTVANKSGYAQHTPVLIPATVVMGRNSLQPRYDYFLIPLRCHQLRMAPRSKTKYLKSSSSDRVKWSA